MYSNNIIKPILKKTPWPIKKVLKRFINIIKNLINLIKLPINLLKK